jgi:hypothetical protein
MYSITPPGMRLPVNRKSNWKDVGEVDNETSPEEMGKYCSVRTPQSRWALGVFVRMAVASIITLSNEEPQKPH